MAYAWDFRMRVLVLSDCSALTIAGVQTYTQASKLMHHRIVRSFAVCAVVAWTQVSAQSVITTKAGTDWLFPGNGLPAVSAPLSGAAYGLDIAFDQNGNLYIADS